MNDDSSLMTWGTR